MVVGQPTVQPVDFDCLQLHPRGGGRRARQSCFTAKRLSVSRIVERRHVRKKVEMFSSDRLEKGFKVAFEHGTSIWHGAHISNRC